MTNIIRTDGNRVVNVLLEVDLFKEGDYIVSYCPALELSSFGLTEDEAKEGFEGALHTFISDTHEKGTLERVLLDLGWSLTKIPTVKYQPPIAKVRTKARNSSLIRTFNEKVAIPVN
jgi:predicted RNase H-like HicB family nuclease